MTPKLTKLPIEIFLIIGEYLEPKEVLVLSETCKNLNKSLKVSKTIRAAAWRYRGLRFFVDRNNISAIRYLIKRGIKDPDATFVNCCAHGSVQTLSLLLESFPEIDLGYEIMLEDGVHRKTIFGQACRHNTVKVVKFLIKRGVDSSQKTSPLSKAIIERNTEVIKYLLSLPNLQISRREFTSCISSGNLELLKVLETLESRLAVKYISITAVFRSVWLIGSACHQDGSVS